MRNEAGETTDINFIASRQRVGDLIQDLLKEYRAVCLRQSRIIVHCGDDCVSGDRFFYHGLSISGLELWDNGLRWPVI